MSAAEIIEQIKALPPQDRRVVLEFARNAEPIASAPSVHFASDEAARAASDRVFAKHKELFKRLAE